jgi:hypothetical protein
MVKTMVKTMIVNNNNGSKQQKTNQNDKRNNNNDFKTIKNNITVKTIMINGNKQQKTIE